MIADLDGLLGADFKDRLVQIDFGAKKIRLLASSDVTRAISIVKLKVQRGVFLVLVGVDDGKPQWFRVDTGCASALQWVVNGRRMAPQCSGMSVGIGIPTTTTQVELGSVIFDSVPTGLHRQPIFSKNGKLVLQGRRPGF